MPANSTKTASHVRNLPLRNAASLKLSRARWKRSFATFLARLDREAVPYLSHSKILTVERCPRCYYRQYVLCEKLETTAILLGNLFHKAAKTFYHASASGPSPDAGQLMKCLNLKRLAPDSKALLRNALVMLRHHQWRGYDVVAIEEPFFMDLARSLPPVIGIPDLVLKRDESFLLIDHKSSKKFNDHDPAQLILYAEHLRRTHETDAIVGVFDEYRLVPDLSKTKKPAFRRTPVSVDRSSLPALIRRYRAAWKRITRIHKDGEPPPSPDCWQCGSYFAW